METEVTVQVFNSIEETIQILKEQGFAETERFELDDWYFSSYPKAEAKEKEYQDLLASSLLVRQIISDGKTKDFLFYKNK